MVCKSDDWLSLWMTEHLACPLQHATVSTVLRWWRPLICAALSSCGSARLQFNTRVSTTSGNVLEFEILSGNTGHLLEFTCSSWKFLYNRLVIDDCLAVIQLLGNWLAQLSSFSYASCIYWVSRITVISGLTTLPVGPNGRLKVSNAKWSPYGKQDQHEAVTM